MANEADKSGVKATQETGVSYISSTGVHYKAPDISVERILAFMDNVYAKGLARKQLHLIFNDPFTLEVYDAGGKLDEGIANDMMRMCVTREVALWSKIKMTWVDYFWMGPALFNEVWDYDEHGVYMLQKLRHLPASSFDTAPDNAPLKVYSELLQGIFINDKGDVEYWQVQGSDGQPKRVKNVTMITEPTSVKLTGEPVILPLIPVISMLKFVWDTQMQQANRTGAKILFIKITDPMPATPENNMVSDMAHAKAILKYWGKNTGFPLRGNMEIIDPHIKDDASNLEIISTLNQMLIDYISPINFLSAGDDGARLGGSDDQRLRMILRWISSIHDWLEDAFSDILQTYLDANKYVDYTVRVVIPTPEVDTTETNIRKADIGLKAKVLGPNELRMLLGHREVSEDELQEIAEYHVNTQPAMAQFNLTSGSAEPGIPPKSVEGMRRAGEILSDEILDALRNEE